MPDKNRSAKATIIALCGKGGVGKTSISALIVKRLIENPDNRVLAIDADPAVGLSTALGITVHKTVDDIRNELIRQVETGVSGDRREMVARLDYEMLTALEERGNLAFLAIGRPEKEGCYCQVNHILKDILGSMADPFEYVVIDGEAGIEQVNRRVMETVTHLVLVSDGSIKGLNVARQIKAVAETAIGYHTAGLIINRLRSEEERARISVPPGLHCLGWITEDDAVRASDMAGKSLLDMDAGPALSAVGGCLAAMGIPHAPECIL